jgi:hypothetical protein
MHPHTARLLSNFETRIVPGKENQAHQMELFVLFQRECGKNGNSMQLSAREWGFLGGIDHAVG